MRSLSSNYDKFPSVPAAGNCWQGWDAIAAQLPARIVCVECYPGVDEKSILCELERRLQPSLTIHARDLLKSSAEVERLVEPFLGGDDPVFGYMSDLKLDEFFDSGRLENARSQVELASGKVLIVGCGASLVHRGDLLVYADLARWEAQLRFRRNESSNLGTDNHDLKWSLQYKRAFFVDWRVADRWKRASMDHWDYLLDTNDSQKPKLVSGQSVRDALEASTKRPFRVVPFFDPAPWGGQWMKEVCDLDRNVPNYGWCFDCVPEENSLLLDFEGINVEIPSIDLVFRHPERLLGEKVAEKFGAEFPIRFDFLDTIEGGNLSFQVHPTNEYVKEKFGMPYTQDESYYILDAEEDASVYLGLKEGVEPAEMIADLERAQDGEAPFDADRYSNKWPAKKHDHFLIPAGTVHCSGKNAMVLEISATPYIFTFKLWDWGRLGLDGKPRPIYINHGKHVIDWAQDTKSTQENLINRFEKIAVGDGWMEERTGLHESEFIETRRHWFTKPVPHHTGGGVNVLNLVEGEAAVVEGDFEPFVVHYAETFIVPAAVGSYTIRPLGEGRHATLKAYVRT